MPAENKISRRIILFLLLAGVIAIVLTTAAAQESGPPQKNITAGAYYFDGWAGRNEHAGETNEPWALDAPTHLTRRMVEEFPEREPLWGWRDDSLSIMERQIDLAADNGLAFFAFCWYWHDNGRAINRQAIAGNPLHTSLELFLKARNNQRLKFCLLVANHEGFEIEGTEHWKQAADFWMPYLKHTQALTVGGKPLLIIFSPKGGDKAGFDYLQEAARKAGLPGVAIAGCGGGELSAGYTHRTLYNVVPGYVSGSERHTYAELIQASEKAWGGTGQQPYIPVLTGGWDKRPWEGPSGLHQAEGWYYPDRTPEQFAGFLRDAIAWMDKNPDQTTQERILLIYAWNEFGEGGYIAPTKGDPDGLFLKALRSVVLPDDSSRREGMK